MEDVIFGHFTIFCISEDLCCKSLMMDNILKLVVQNFNFIRSRGRNDPQFDNFLREKDEECGLPYHAELRWLSRGAVLRDFFELRE